MAELQLRRRHDVAGIFREMIISCDGAEIARLRPGRRETVEAEAARHEIVASMDWVTSPAVEVDLSSEAPVVLETALPWKGFRPILRAIRRGDDPRATTGSEVILLQRV